MITLTGIADHVQPGITDHFHRNAQLGHGIARPSRDIDVDVTGDGDPWERLAAAARQAGLHAMAEPSAKHRLKGTLTLADDAIGTTRIEVDIRPIREAEAIARLDDPAVTETRQGIRMYTARELAAQKITMVTERLRLRGRDRYDIAWWLRQRPDAVAPAHRIALDRALRADPEIRTAWDANHREDEILRRVRPEAVHDALNAALDGDPHVLFARHPEGEIELMIDSVGGASVEWTPAPGDPRTRTLAELDTDQELEHFMVSRGLWAPSDAPAHHATLAQARETAQLRAAEQASTAGTDRHARWHEASVACTGHGYFVHPRGEDGLAGATRGPLADTEALHDVLRAHGIFTTEGQAQRALAMLEKLERRAARGGGGRVMTLSAGGAIRAEGRRSNIARQLLHAIATTAAQGSAGKSAGDMPTPGARAAEHAIRQSTRARVQALKLARDDLAPSHER